MYLGTSTVIAVVVAVVTTIVMYSIILAIFIVILYYFWKRRKNKDKYDLQNIVQYNIKLSSYTGLDLKTWILIRKHMKQWMGKLNVRFMT